MREKNLYSSLIWVAFGLYIAFEGYRLNLGTLHNPGSGFLVFWTGLTISALSTALFLTTYFRREEGQRILWRGLQWPQGVKLMAALFVYAVFFKSLGFLLSTFLLLLFLFKGSEGRRWRAAFLSAGITAVSSYVIFGVFLETQLPRGFLEEAMSRLYQFLLGPR